MGIEAYSAWSGLRDSFGCIMAGNSTVCWVGDKISVERLLLCWLIRGLIFCLGFIKVLVELIGCFCYGLLMLLGCIFCMFACFVFNCGVK